ncbi:squalene/phytoene synthase family protein [Sphingomonas sp. KR1UV-12]|uniref:Squalene/phytoene synthase family protein n=1 Tax=Sphingomonas aurea TaxID=3063994 RepID=A0ABT9EHN9_9SPHN|nr:squalene/phytoene synthase family protein [Sphingomonas sp. KR1UV-12]MDP1026434.1 squalene/phytoene synthase family protein [Sphingomonas sp. KR1UV-12]
MSVNIPYDHPPAGAAFAPPVLLAIGYAPVAARAGLAALLHLDRRLGDIVRAAREPLIAQMRLTWWHDALSTLDDGAWPAEPLLQALATHVLPRGTGGATLAGMIDGWEVLLGQDPLSADDLVTYARQRGGGLFAAIARTVAADADDPVALAGEGWALADLAAHVRDPSLADRVRAMAAARRFAARTRWSRRGRAMGALALLAAHPDAGPWIVARLFWHRLTGR